MHCLKTRALCEYKNRRPALSGPAAKQLSQCIPCGVQETRQSGQRAGLSAQGYSCMVVAYASRSRSGKAGTNSLCREAISHLLEQATWCIVVIPQRVALELQRCCHKTGLWCPDCVIYLDLGGNLKPSQ